MKYISTNMATDWPVKEPWQSKVLKTILFFIPKANPGYEPKIHLVKKWLIEFEEEDGKLLPWREIGLDSNGTPVIAGPDKENYGFWLDTNMEYKDFEGEPIDKDEFEKVWKLTGIEAIKIDKES